MFSLSDNYYKRKCYFKREQVPTQSVIKDRMKPPLAMVYFKSMDPKLKVLAGLEPPLRGGGTDWFQPPDELLKGRAVLQPVKKEYLTKLGTNIINIYADVLMINHQLRMQAESRKALSDNDHKWKLKIVENCNKQQEETASDEAQKNSQKILQAFAEFQLLYTTSTTRIDDMLRDSAQQEMQRVHDEAYVHMNNNFRSLIKQQATMLYDRYTNRLNKEKERMKSEFILKVQNLRTELGNQIHDIHLEKHTAIEKVRHLLECHNLACQVYVALKEREECQKQLDLSKHYHEKLVRQMTEKIHVTDLAIRREEEQEMKRLEFKRIWKKKICHVVKKFQIFMEYCLKMMPQHAEFFENMEALMMTQLNEAAENPNADSLFEPDEKEAAREEKIKTPEARPHPLYLCWDKSCKPQLDQDLCPKHCTSSASHMPVVIVNNRCIYGACDNFEQFTDKITQYIHGEKGNDADVRDEHDYSMGVPMKQTMSSKLEELKLESSLMQILQEELPNVKQVRTECCVCKIPHCFCYDVPATTPKVEEPAVPEPVIEYGDPGNILERTGELTASREPKLESYMDYVMPKCKCAKTAKKHLKEHLPPYMMMMSKFDVPDLPQYETCPLPVLKKLVKKARKVRTPPPSPPPQEPKTKDVCTQYEDEEFQQLCNCFSREEVIKIFDDVMKDSNIYKQQEVKACDVVRDVPGSTDNKTEANTNLATDLQFSIKELLTDDPELRELFKGKDCKDFDRKSVSKPA